MLVRVELPVLLLQEGKHNTEQSRCITRAYKPIKKEADFLLFVYHKLKLKS